MHLILFLSWSWLTGTGKDLNYPFNQVYCQYKVFALWTETTVCCHKGCMDSLLVVYARVIDIGTTWGGAAQIISRLGGEAYMKEILKHLYSNS